MNSIEGHIQKCTDNTSFASKHLFWFGLLIGFLGFNACFYKNVTGKQTLVMEHVNLISMEADQYLPDQTVVITDNVITSVGPSGEVAYPTDSKVINAKGKYLIPGLCDMHMHIDHPDVLKVNLAFGITTVMNYRGLPEHLILRDRSAHNEILSPNIYTTGDYMEGYPATVPGFLSFNNVGDARKSVENQKKLGYDFIKVYRNLDTLMHDAICDEAVKNELAVVGHLSPEISLQQSLAAGQKVIAHVEELMYFFDNQNDTSRIKELIDLLKRYEVTFTPNLTIFRSLPLQVENLDSINAQKVIQDLQPALFQSWRKEFNFNYRRGEDWAKFMWERFTFLQEVTQEIHNAGIPILTSSDAPTSGALPGLAVHNELKELRAVGFTTFEALKAATVLPGEFINKYVKGAERFGLVKEGFRADLLLLDKNPLENIEYTQTIYAVVKNGTWYPKDVLDKELYELHTVYEEVDPIVKSIEKAVANENVQEARNLFDQGQSQFKDQLFLGYYTMWYEGYRFLYENRRLTDNPERAEKAVMFYQMYLEQYPDMHGSHYLLGLAYKANKDTARANISFEKSLKLHPHNPYAKAQIEELKN